MSDKILNNQTIPKKNFPSNKAREFKLKKDQTADPILQRDDRYVKAKEKTTRPETKNYLKIIQKKNLRHDISSDNIKNKNKQGIITETTEKEYISGIKVNINKQFAKTPEIKKRRRGKKINHERKVTNISKLLVQPSENVKRENLTPEKPRLRHIKQVTNVGFCLDYNKTPKQEKRKKGIKVYNDNKPSENYIKMNSKTNYQNIAFDNGEKQNIMSQRKKIKNINESTYKDLFERDFSNNYTKTPRLRYNIQRDNVGDIFDSGMGVIEREYIAGNPTKGNFEQLINQISVNNQDKFIYKHYE